MIRIIATILIASIAATASAQEPRSPVISEAEALVRGFVHDLDTLSAQFEQTLIDSSGEVMEVSKGFLKISRPGRFRWAYEEPYEQWLVADGLNIWSYDVDLAQVTVKSQAEALANTPALLLGGTADAMDEFVVDTDIDETSLGDDSDMTWVRLRPVDTDSGFQHVELGFRDRVLTRMVFFDNLQQTTLIYLSDVLVDGDIDDEAFSFVAPEDVDVVGTPATADAG